MTEQVTDVPAGHTLVSLIDGVLVTHDASGAVTRSKVHTHSRIDKAAVSSREGMLEAFKQTLQLNRFQVRGTGSIRRLIVVAAQSA